MFVKLYEKNALPPGEPKTFKIKGIEVLIVNVGNKIYCLDARCTHAGAALSEGILEGEVLTCPWHYSQFNISNGDAVRGLAQKPLKTYRTEERENLVFIDL